MSNSGSAGIGNADGGIFSDSLQRARPGAVGVDARVVEQCLDELDSAGVDLHSFVLHRRDHIAVEVYRWPYGPERPRLMHSVAKSFTACAIGMALQERRFSLTDRVIDFFPEYLSGPPEPKLAAMTVEDLLTMRTGHAKETSGAVWRGLQGSWIREFFAIPVVHQPGTVYRYTSAASYMLSAILTRATGQTLHEYLRSRLFGPLGITGETWDIGPDGINPGGNGLTCKTVDVLKLGVLHAARGVWRGRRLLSEEWIAQATRAHSHSGYGYHWVSGPGHSFSAMGVFGQMLIVFPDQEATLALTAAVNGEHACTGVLAPVLHKHFPTAFRDAPLGQTDAEERLIRRTCDAASTPRLLSVQRPDACPGTLDYRVEPNPLGVSSLQLTLSEEKYTLLLVDEEGGHSIEMGIDRWLEGETRVPGRSLHHGYDMRPARVVAGARWLDRETLEMSWIFVESAFRDTVICRFSGDQLKFARSVNVNSGPLRQPELLAYRVNLPSARGS